VLSKQTAAQGASEAVPHGATSKRCSDRRWEGGGEWNRWIDDEIEDWDGGQACSDRRREGGEKGTDGSTRLENLTEAIFTAAIWVSGSDFESSSAGSGRTRVSVADGGAGSESDRATISHSKKLAGANHLKN
jgi:hypothetical protein